MRMIICKTQLADSIQAQITISCWVKSDGADTDFYIGNLIAGSYETRTATSEWDNFTEVTQTPLRATRYPRPVDSIDGTETRIFGARNWKKVSSAGAYIPNHTNAAITADVLIPRRPHNWPRHYRRESIRERAQTRGAQS